MLHAVGVDFLTKQLTIDDTTLKMTFWDTAGSVPCLSGWPPPQHLTPQRPGQERYGSIVRLYFRHSKAVVLVYDLSRPETAEELERSVGVAA